MRQATPFTADELNTINQGLLDSINHLSQASTTLASHGLTDEAQAADKRIREMTNLIIKTGSQPIATPGYYTITISEAEKNLLLAAIQLAIDADQGLAEHSTPGSETRKAIEQDITTHTQIHQELTKATTPCSTNSSND